MSSATMSFNKCQAMLLDVENTDAEIIAREVGTSKTNTNAGTGLIGDTVHRNQPPPEKRKKKRKKKKKAEKSAKYNSEGPCPVHGSICSHAGSECWVLHPQLKPDKETKGVGGIADAGDGKEKDNGASEYQNPMIM